MASILVADSGSTKTDWILIEEGNGILEVQTEGINPVRDSRDTISLVLHTSLVPSLPPSASVSSIHFYGAGCIDPYRASVVDALTEAFPHAAVSVDSDLLGAARALCADKAGIACILGTGSNSCLYDGRQIRENVSPMGFILGDEGSGAVLGRTLVGNIFKGVFPQHLAEAFEAYFHLSLPDIIDKVYRQPQPNRFLASLVPFIQEHRHEPSVRAMLVEQFRAFFSRNVRKYNHPDMPVNFVGSIAFIYEAELREAAQLEGFTIGKILKNPAREIAFYHQNHPLIALNAV